MTTTTTMKTSASLITSKMVLETNKIVSDIKANAVTINKIEIVKTEIINTNILWIQLLLYDGDVLPIKIDILKNLYVLKKIVSLCLQI